jgi:pimeloyl-ACP methyl ester carboxylesterase
VTSARQRAVLLHGAATTGRSWQRVIPHLSNMDVRCPDRPCSGDLDTELASVASLCADAIVVGVSGGATIGLALAARSMPMRAAVLHEPAAGSLAPGLLAHVAEGLRADGVAGFGRALYGPSWSPADAPTDPTAVTRDFAMFGAFEPTTVGPGVGPVLLTVGEHSPASRHQSVRALSAHLDVPYQVIPGAHHAVHLDAPAAFAAVVVGFVSTVAPGSRRRRLTAPKPTKEF